MELSATRPEGLSPGELGSIAPSTPLDTNHSVLRVRVSQGVMAGLLLSKVPPEYPAAAKDKHIQGVVLLRVIIDREGNASNLRLISGHPLLAPAAIDAVKQWKYKPYLLNGSTGRSRNSSHRKLHARPIAVTDARRPSRKSSAQSINPVKPNHFVIS